MRSQADTRRWVERGWRALALLALAWALVVAFRPRARAAERVAGVDLAAALPRLTRVPAPLRIDAVLDAAPPARERAWLAALRRGGDSVVWRPSRDIPALALEVVPRADPAGGVRVLVAAPRGDTVWLADRAGPLDTLPLLATVAVRRLTTFVAPVTARVGGQEARATVRDSLAPRRVLVLGAAGWEAKFVLAALEERGWRASARFGVAPGVAVTQGATQPLDTAHFAAVVVLDSGAAGEARALAAFARAGGGLLLAGEGARTAAFRAVAPGAVGARVRAEALTFSDSAPRRALAFNAIAGLRADAVALEMRNGRIAVAARREGAGRVTQVGYDDTWRWRFAGGPRAPEAERAWWSALLSGVAYRAAEPVAGAVDGNTAAAPLAQLVAALGPGEGDGAAPGPAVPAGLRWWIAAVIGAALLAEWGSRRFRGAP